MGRKKRARTSKLGPEKEPRLWRPTNRQVLWAIGLVVTLVTITLLVDSLYPAIWQALSRERVAMLIGIGVALVVVIVLLAIGGASLGWTGFADKTLWEWLQLLSSLAIPLVLAAAGFWFTVQQDQRQQQIEDQRAQQAQKIENQRANAERELAEQRAQDEALQAYLDQMNNLLLEHNLRNSKEDSGVRTLARARTLTVLERLDPSRKTVVMQFLVEAKLVQRVEKRPPLIGLSGANLSGVVLNSSDYDLSGADLFNANLSDATLSYTNLSHADLLRVDLRSAFLDGAYLKEARLSEADLTGTDLSGKDLSGADLSGAILQDASGVTKEMLEQQAKSLRGATMPDGTIHPGPYTTREFKPALSFSLSDGWQLSFSDSQYSETFDTLDIEVPKGGELSFSSPTHVFDPSNPSEQKEVPAPENTDEWVSWFQSHPKLDTSKPVPVSVGGASGKRIDVTVTSTPENYPYPRYVSLYAVRFGTTIRSSVDGWKDRFVIVDVEGNTVVIDVAAPAHRFDEFLTKAQKVLDTVEWKGG